MRRRWIIMACLQLGLLQLAGCERMLHNMYDQPRGKAHGASAFFSDGAASRTPPDGTVTHARGPRPGSSSGRLGADDTEQRVRDESAPTQPYLLSEQLLARGQKRFNIYCLPCHSPVGDGDGRIARRGFPAPPTYHSDRLRGVPDRYIYDVITHGYGVMASYADRITPADRWAIVAYVRALQLSQHARLVRLPATVAEPARKALSATTDNAAQSESAANGGQP